mmetsp:Transcript_25196/g.71788  ORF Transcript_25196/g.71788 Transcript_25196/m.71788 type:complete len:216 (+) Transcript_25196:267-914(+)
MDHEYHRACSPDLWALQPLRDPEPPSSELRASLLVVGAAVVPGAPRPETRGLELREVTSNDVPRRPRLRQTWFERQSPHGRVDGQQTTSHGTRHHQWELIRSAFGKHRYHPVGQLVSLLEAQICQARICIRGLAHPARLVCALSVAHEQQPQGSSVRQVGRRLELRRAHAARRAARAHGAAAKTRLRRRQQPQLRGGCEHGQGTAEPKHRGQGSL